MFKSRFTKWIPLGNYQYGGTDYITFVRKNLKTGMMFFKTKQVNTNWSIDTNTNNILPSKLINVEMQWDLIVTLS